MNRVPVDRPGTAGPQRPSQGVQLIGGLYREDLCLDTAAAIEKRLGTITPMDPR